MQFVFPILRPESQKAELLTNKQRFVKIFSKYSLLTKIKEILC